MKDFLHLKQTPEEKQETRDAFELAIGFSSLLTRPESLSIVEKRLKQVLSRYKQGLLSDAETRKIKLS